MQNGEKSEECDLSTIVAPIGKDNEIESQDSDRDFEKNEKESRDKDNTDYTEGLLQKEQTY